MALLLYLATAAMLLWLAQRYIAPIERRVMVVLLLLPLVFCGKALLTGGVYAPADGPYVTEPLKAMMEPLGLAPIHTGAMSDLYAQMIPWRKAVQFAVSHRQWPVWNPFMLSGDVLAASAQPAAYSPFTLLACLLPVAQSLTFSAALSFFIAGLGAYLFARELGCRDSVALFAAAGWMYAKPLAFFILWAIGASWAMFPFVLLATRRVVWTPSVRSTALLAAALTLLLLAGHPETVVQAVFAGALYGGFELARRRRELARVVVATLAAGAASVALCAIYILPIFEAAPQTIEHAFRTGGWAEQSHGAILRETGARVLTDFFPWLHGALWQVQGVKYLPLDSVATGSLVLALAAYAIARIRSAETWFLAALALFGLLARAAWTPLMDALSKLPMLDVTINERFSFAAAFAIVILAALGLEYALAREDLRGLWITLAVALAVVAAGSVIIGRANLILDVIYDWGHYARFAEVACLAAATVVVMAKPPLRALVPLLFVVLLAQRYLEDGDVYPTIPARGAYPHIPIFDAIRRDQGPFRIVGHAFAFVPGTSALYELEDVRGYEALTFAPYFETYSLWCMHQPVWFNRVDDIGKPFLNFLNVRYAVSSQELVPPRGWRIVAKQRGAQLLENANAIERAFIPRSVRLGLPEGDAMLEMADETDFRQRAWIHAPVPAQTWTNAGGTLRLARRGADFKIDADMRGAGWVVLSEPAWKGWRVYVDDRRVQWFVANEAFIGFYVPAGKHSIRVAYLPEAFVRGRMISFAALAGVVVFGLWWRRRAK